MRLPWQRAKTKATTDPGRPHAFVETSDSGIGAMAAGSGMSGRSGGETQLAVTAAVLRATRCGLPGCGKAREDPIHEPEE